MNEKKKEFHGYCPVRFEFYYYGIADVFFDLATFNQNIAVLCDLYQTSCTTPGVTRLIRWMDSITYDWKSFLSTQFDGYYIIYNVPIELRSSRIY